MIVTVHDFIPERFPKQFGWKSRLLSAAKRRTCFQADRILAISETTKSDLVDRFNISPDIVDVAYLGNALSVFTHELDDSPCEAPYILYVGARGGYKNCKTFWEAYARSIHLKKNFRIDCFGGGTFTSEERALLEDLKISHLVRQCGGDDRTLARYYRHASVLVYPSIYEGFGFPPVEAMSFGCPVIVSTGGSIPEVVGPVGVYFNPLDCDMLTEAMERVLFDETAKDDLRVQMRERAARFRWEVTARQTLECYRKAAA
jgi:glycosyltransferase involved in cell wall biosynthesis